MTRERRFLVDELADRVELRGEEAHHLLHVLRLDVGAEVVLFDGRGRARRAVVAGLSRGAATLDVFEEEPSRESPLPLAVGVALLKADRMALVVQKLTELGVARIFPLVAERGEVRSARAATALDRWRRIALEAAKQSGRSRVPELSDPLDLSGVLDAAAAETVLLAHPGAREATLPAPPGSVLALVGPEGGFSPAETAMARERGAKLIGLGPRTLRAETAAIAVATLLQFHSGDLAGA